MSVMEDRRIPARDGGTLALYTYGDADAPGDRRVLVIGGAFLTALIYRPFSLALATALGDGWAVDVYDRRGRGSSTPQPPDYSMATEVSDVALLLETTGARHVFGHSLGGSVALNAVRELAGTALAPLRLAVYDAAINIDNSVDTGWIAAFAQAVDAGNVPRAMARLRRGMGAGGPLARVPEPILAALLLATTRTKAGRAFRELMPTAVGELRAGMEEAVPASEFAVLPDGTGFLAGAKSPAYFRHTAALLHAAVPGSTLTVTPKMVHGSVPAAVGELVADVAAHFTQVQESPGH